MLSWEDKKFRGIRDIVTKLKEIPQAVGLDVHCRFSADNGIADE